MLSATTPRTRRCPSRSLARLTYPPGGQFLSPTLAPAARPRLRHPSRELAAGRARTVLPAPRVRRPRPHLSLDPPLLGGSARAGDPQPLPRNVPPSSGGGGNPSSFPPGPGPVVGPRLGRVPAPNTLRKPRKKCWARPGRAPGLPTLAGPRSASPAAAAPPRLSGGRPRSAGSKGGGAGSCWRDRGPARRPAARSLTCQLSSQ